MVTYLADNTDLDLWGYFIARDTGLYNGTVYPLLHHLHESGWVTRRAETVTEWRARAPHRRGDSRLRTYYRMTAAALRASQRLTPRRKSRRRTDVSGLVGSTDARQSALLE